MPGETAWSHVFLILATCCQARAAIHQYDGQLFYQVGDAFIFRGGREGLYASTQEVSLTRLLAPVPSARCLWPGTINPGSLRLHVKQACRCASRQMALHAPFTQSCQELAASAEHAAGLL